MSSAIFSNHNLVRIPFPFGENWVLHNESCIVVAVTYVVFNLSNSDVQKIRRNQIW